MINFQKKQSHFLTNSRLHVTLTSRSTNSHVILSINPCPREGDEHDVRVAPIKNNLGLDNGQCHLVDRRLLPKVVGTVHTNMEPWFAGLLAVKDYIVLSNT